MPILTTKELQALNDQLDFERVLHCKYLAAVQELSLIHISSSLSQPVMLPFSST